jgi:hypothetical protein
VEPVSAQLRRDGHSCRPNPVQYLFPHQPTEEAAIATLGGLVSGLTTNTSTALWPI